MSAPIRFVYNGLKVEGKLYRAYIWKDRDGGFTVSAKGYGSFPAVVGEVFKVRNESDLMTDYFDHDTFTVSAGHTMHAEVLAVFQKNEARDEARRQARLAKCAAARAAS